MQCSAAQNRVHRHEGGGHKLEGLPLWFSAWGTRYQ